MSSRSLPPVPPSVLLDSSKALNNNKVFDEEKQKRQKAVALIALTIIFTVLAISGSTAGFMHFVTAGGPLNLCLGISSAAFSAMGTHLLKSRAKDWFENGNITDFDKWILRTLALGGTLGFGSVLGSHFFISSSQITPLQSVLLGSVGGPLALFAFSRIKRIYDEIIGKPPSDASSKSTLQVAPLKRSSSSSSL